MKHNKPGREKFLFLPQVQVGELKEMDAAERNKTHCQQEEPESEPIVKGDSLCPCCGYLTIPNGGNALAYICPVCFWEIDLFIQSDDEPSDQNHGLTLVQARKNYRQYGAVLPRLVRYVRAALPEEKVIPEKE